MIEAIIFDNDGLLVDSEPVWDHARRDMAEEAGKTWNSDDHKAVMGVSTEEWANYMIQRLELKMTIDEVIQRIIDRMIAMYNTQIPFMKGALEAVEVASNLYPTAVASGSHPDLLAAVMSAPALQNKFRVVLSADTVGAGKPEPDIYLETARQLGVDPKNCLCLEDSGNGILSGVRAGMQVVAVPDPRFPPKPELLSQAHYTLDSLLDFPSLLNELRS